jgi:hypothetical protein
MRSKIWRALRIGFFSGMLIGVFFGILLVTVLGAAIIVSGVAFITVSLF